MTKQEFNEEQINNLKAILHKGVSVWIERNKIDTNRIEFKNTVSQTKLNTEIFVWFLIQPEEEEK